MCVSGLERICMCVHVHVEITELKYDAIISSFFIYQNLIKEFLIN